MLSFGQLLCTANLVTAVLLLCLLWQFLSTAQIDGFSFLEQITFPPMQPAVITNTTEAAFDWTRILRDNYEMIRDEFEALSQTNPGWNDLEVDALFPNQQYLNSKGGWKIVLLKCYGSDVESELVQLHFPGTLKLIREAQTQVRLHEVIISALEPATSIPRHRGFYQGNVRYQLALSVPRTKAKIYSSGYGPTQPERA